MELKTVEQIVFTKVYRRFFFLQFDVGSSKTSIFFTIKLYIKCITAQRIRIVLQNLQESAYIQPTESLSANLFLNLISDLALTQMWPETLT